MNIPNHLVEHSVLGLNPTLHVPIGNIGTRIFTCAGGKQVTAASNRTYMNQMALEQHFDAVRLVYKNISGNVTGDFKLGDVSVSVGGTVSDKFNNAGAWVSGVFGGVTPTAASPVTVPTSTGTTDADPDFYFSDWIPISSIPRGDGGTLPLLYVRTFYPTSISAYPFDISYFGDTGKGSDVWGSNPPDSRTWRNQWMSGNKAVNTAGAVPVWTEQGDHIHSALAGVQYLARGRVINVLSFGDSITLGTNGTAATGVTVQGRSPTHLACVNVTNMSGIAVQHSNCGIAGQDHVQYYTRFTRMLPLFFPDVVVYSSGTPNYGAYNQGHVDNESFYVMRALDLCKTNRAIPILWTEIPYNSADGVSHYTAGQDAFRQTYVAKINAMSSNGILVADTDAALTAGGSPAPARVGTMSTDWLHPNDTGYTAMSAPITAKLAEIVRANK